MAPLDLLFPPQGVLTHGSEKSESASREGRPKAEGAAETLDHLAAQVLVSPSAPSLPGEPSQQEGRAAEAASQPESGPGQVGVDLARFCTSESSRPVLPYTVLSPNTGFRDDQARSAARRRRPGGYRPRQARRPVPPAGLLLPAEGAAHCGTDHAGVLVLQ